MPPSDQYSRSAATERSQNMSFLVRIATLETSAPQAAPSRLVAHAFHDRGHQQTGGDLRLPAGFALQSAISVTRTPMKRVCLFAPILCLAFFFALCNASAQEVASMRVDVRKKTGEISPYLFGQFIEYLGRCIAGGIFEEGSPLSDTRGFRRDVIEKVRALHPSLLRFPGGTYTKVYHWKDGIGSPESRPRKRNLIWGGIEDNRFGTDEYVQYCRQIGCEPFIVVNMGSGTPEEAADWVEYCNGTGNTHYANLRRSNGQTVQRKILGIGKRGICDRICRSSARRRQVCG